ncbi:hypothetical protein D3C71_2122870 [compost metagenome]
MNIQLQLLHLMFTVPLHDQPAKIIDIDDANDNLQFLPPPRFGGQQGTFEGYDNILIGRHHPLIRNL